MTSDQPRFQQNERKYIYMKINHNKVSNFKEKENTKLPMEK